MDLSNAQYSKILREYDKRQFETRHLLEKRTKEVYSQIPQLKQLDNRLITNSINYAKLSLKNSAIDLSRLETENLRISKRKTELLVQNGFPPDYLSPVYICPDCQDTGFIHGEKCHCFRQAIVDMVYTQSNVKETLKKENFSTFSYTYYDSSYVDETTGLTPLENIKRVVASCAEFIKTFDTNYSNLLFYGNTGVGKTFLTNCIAKELLDSAHTVIYLTAFQLFDILEKYTFNKNEGSKNIEIPFYHILDCDLLIIDDLGTELTNSFINSRLYLCINERHLKEKSTIISTNLSLDDLNQTYSERIFSRITSNYILLKIVGEDIRIKKVFSV